MSALFSRPEVRRDIERAHDHDDLGGNAELASPSSAGTAPEGED
jgi:hypothetical protein